MAQIDGEKGLVTGDIESGDAFPKILKTKSISDRQYELVQRLCPRCETVHFEIFRFSGASFSRYHLDETFEEDDFDIFVDNIDEMLLQSAADLIEDFLRALIDKNSEHGIEADWTFAFRLLEYGRHRTSALSKMGMLDAIISRAEPRTKAERAVRAAFELGMATAEHRLLDTYEHYLWDGMALSDWRETGLPMARAERLRCGKITHTAVVGAARRLY